jgi:hypothetical protein
LLADPEYRAQVTAHAWEQFCIAKETHQRQEKKKKAQNACSGKEGIERTEKENG